MTPESASRLNLTVSEGAAILVVAENSPTSAAGLRSGDIVVGVDDTPVTSSGDVRRAVRAKQPGETMTLTVRRGGAEKQMTAQREGIEPP